MEKALTTVERVVTVPADRLITGLDRRYPSVRRFLPELLRLVDFDATTKADPVLAAVRHPAAVERGTATIDDAPLAAVTPAWRSLVQPSPLPPPQPHHSDGLTVGDGPEERPWPR